MSDEHPKNPYPGPRPFEPSEASIFAGRDDEKEELSALVIAHRAVLLYAQSGAGKSSLVQAGIIPRLTERGVECLPTARVGLTPTQRGAADGASNVFAFSVISSLLPDSEAEWRKHATIADAVARIPQHLDESKEAKLLVLVLDQFEELFSRSPERWQDREQFFVQVSSALEKHRHFRVLFVLREDWLASFVEFAPLLPDGVRTRFHLDRMREAEALLAIERPLEGAPQYFADGAAEALARDLASITVATRSGKTVSVPGEFVDLVQLQVVCYGLFSRLPADRTEITLQDLEAFGDVDGALRRFYEQAVSAAATATNISARAIRTWFDRQLITPVGTRGLVFQSNAHTGGIPNQVVDILASYHLIRPETRSGTQWYELTHDRFIRPILRSNAEWRAGPAPASASAPFIATVRGLLDLDAGQLVSELVGLSVQGLTPVLSRGVNELRSLTGMVRAGGPCEQTHAASTQRHGSDRPNPNPARSNRKLGMCFSGTGLRAVFEAGVIERLYDDPRFRAPHVVTGMSHGAVNAALLAAGRHPAELRAFWFNLARRMHSRFAKSDSWREAIAMLSTTLLNSGEALRVLFRDGARSAFDDLLMGHRHELAERLARTLAVNQRANLDVLRESLVEALGAEAFTPKQCRLCVFGIDADTGEELRFATEAPPRRANSDRYKIVPAITVDMILSAVGLPLLAPPVLIAGRRVWNGGVLAATPMASLLAFGADDIVMMLGARHASTKPDPDPGLQLTMSVDRLLELLIESAYNVDRRRLHACNRVAADNTIVVERGYRDVNLYEPIRPSSQSVEPHNMDFSRALWALERMHAHGSEVANSWLAHGPRPDHIERTASEVSLSSERWLESEIGHLVHTLSA